MRDLNRDGPRRRTIVVMQWAQCLMGKTKDPKVLSGEAFDPDMYKGALNHEAIFQATRYFYEGLLYVYFGLHEKHVQLILDVGEEFSFQKASPGAIANHTEPFIRGLSFFVVARERRNKKYLKYGKKMLKKIKAWIAKGNPNLNHYESLLDAELAFLKGDAAAAEKHYSTAVLLSARVGFVHDAGLASERKSELATRCVPQILITQTLSSCFACNSRICNISSQRNGKRGRSIVSYERSNTILQ